MMSCVLPDLLELLVAAVPLLHLALQLCTHHTPALKRLLSIHVNETICTKYHVLMYLNRSSPVHLWGLTWSASGWPCLFPSIYGHALSRRHSITLPISGYFTLSWVIVPCFISLLV